MSDIDNILVNYWYENYKNGGQFILRGAKCFTDIDEVLRREAPNYFSADYWDLNQHPEMNKGYRVIYLNKNA